MPDAIFAIMLPRIMIQHVRQIERNEDYFIGNILAELMLDTLLRGIYI
jgi:hypothetical protein